MQVFAYIDIVRDKDAPAAHSEEQLATHRQHPATLRLSVALQSLQISQADIEIEKGLEIDSKVGVYHEVIHNIVLKIGTIGVVVHLSRSTCIHHLRKATFARKEDAELLSRFCRVHTVPIGNQLGKANFVVILQRQALHQSVIDQPRIAEKHLRVATYHLLATEQTRHCAILLAVELVVRHKVDIVEKAHRAKHLLHIDSCTERVFLVPLVAQHRRKRDAEHRLRSTKTAARVLRIVEIEVEIGIQIESFTLRQSTE